MINRIKNKIHALVFWQTSVGELVNKIYDLKLFYKYSFDQNHLETKEKFEYYLTKQYHIIEKGLSLPKPRLEFAQKTILNLINKSTRYHEIYGTSELLTSISSCLNEYLNFNKINNVNTDTDYYNSIREFIDKVKPNNLGGTKEITKKDILKSIDFDFEKFLGTRTSVRDFTDKEVELNQIIEVINLAKLSPSVCNRQGWNVHVYSDPTLINQLLILQNGNRGFTESINKLLIIVGDMRSFTKLESNQIYIDGGMFSMNILLSLHAKGLGAVALNTCMPYTTEKKVKELAELQEYEKLIMMIAVGNIKDNFKVAMSNRKDTNQVYQLHS